MSRRESWDSTTGSKAVSAQAWRFWHEISGATCRLTPDSGCCTRRKVQDSRGWFGKCSHNSFTDTSYETLKDIGYLALTFYPMMGILQLVTQMVLNKTATLESKRRIGRRQTKEIPRYNKWPLCFSCPSAHRFSLQHGGFVLCPYNQKVTHTWITRESALTDTPELWAPSIGCVTILVSPPTKPIPRPLTPATKWSLELPNLSALIASRLSWNFVSIDAFHRPSDNDPVI